MKTEIEKPSYALSMRGINKTFPGVKALTSVDFEIFARRRVKGRGNRGGGWRVCDGGRGSEGVGV